MSNSPGNLYGIGIGPGDPELLTIKGLRLLQAAPVVAYPMSENKPPLARSIIAQYLTGNQIEIPMLLPFKLEQSSQPYYDAAAEKIAEYLVSGKDVVVLCEGDPFFFGTFMYIYNRLSPRFHTEVVPGVSSVMASASALGVPLTYRNDVFMVLSSILSAEVLAEKLAVADAAVIIKLGKHFPKVYEVLQQLGLAERAKYIERATTSKQRIVPINEVNPDDVPYFALIVVPSQWKPDI
ncbi:precorrin-2 C(20)-methyltransferase [Calothrix sp. PCC 6303]|uniref:precorrin-2 C(20)-methyltransferase n=1 Tax=Calothrix sp. PCC 6303 TaxID=1170562 RepID=UPI0002A02B24|nr:precorrin-2 C(20)-methyltransferase [Calothrix sp. PCC 6303]AFZ04232.1 precorrin-2 C20-methyltransferase [Calothrix sp. PCC 6303]